MSTVDTSTWSPDSSLNTEIGGIPLTADASIQQTWQAIQMLMAALKGDTSEIKLTINQPDGTTIVATNQTLTVVDNAHAHTIANVTGLQSALSGKASNADMEGATSLADGAAGLVPKPLVADVDKVLGAGGAWRLLTAADISSGTLDLARIPTMDAAHIPSLDASKIASGTIDLARLPAAALERLVIVADQTARFALTDADVQLGDTVKESDTGCMFFVVDTDHLDGASGYEQYTAGSASSVPWSGVTGKPFAFPPESHAHGNISNGGALSTASRAVVTDSSGLMDVSSVTAAEIGHLSGVTSAVQTQLDAKAADSAVVHLSGAETVAGTKTFSAKQILYREAFHRGSATDYLQFSGGSDWGAGARITLYGESHSTAAGYVNIRVSSTSQTKIIAAHPDGTFTWDGQNIQVSSDERIKTPLSAVPDAVLDAWGDVQWGQFQYLEAVAEKGEAARLHLGLIAQRVKVAFEARGLDACAYGILCHEERPATDEEPAVDLWMVRYAEAQAMEAAFQRRRADRLEARIAALEEAMR